MLWFGLGFGFGWWLWFGDGFWFAYVLVAVGGGPDVSAVAVFHTQVPMWPAYRCERHDDVTRRAHVTWVVAGPVPWKPSHPSGASSGGAVHSGPVDRVGHRRVGDVLREVRRGHELGGGLPEPGLRPDLPERQAPNRRGPLPPPTALRPQCRRPFRPGAGAGRADCPVPIPMAPPPTEPGRRETLTTGAAGSCP